MPDFRVQDFLRAHVDLFKDFPAERLDDLVKGSRLASFEPNEAIIEFGEEGRFLGILIEGEAAASVTSDSGERLVLGHLKPGDTFGEMALMTGEKTMADVIAETRCLALIIPITLFSTTIVTHPPTVRLISKLLADRLKMSAEKPEMVAAAFRKSEDPYGLSLKSERPEKILVVNCGSSSLKYYLFDTVDEKRNARGVVERIKAAGSSGTSGLSGPSGASGPRVSTGSTGTGRSRGSDGSGASGLSGGSGESGVSGGSGGSAGSARPTGSTTGAGGLKHTYRGPQGEAVRELPAGGHREAFEAMVKELTAAGTGVLGSPSEVTVVGHRVVHGGEKFSEAVLITDDVQKELGALTLLAPLHNPVNVIGIQEARRVFPYVPHVAAFDTAFHSTLPSYAYLYGLPFEYYEKNHLRRYGFHGMSHSYVCLRAAQHLKRRYNELEIVSCHLGNGASICAVDHGRSVDTSMGLTPTEGLIMGTRCGDVDPGAFIYLARTAGITGDKFEELINRGSGLLGLSGISQDMREIEKAAQEGHHRALLALKTFAYRVRKYIGAYVAAMGGLDAIVFTGGIGQGSAGVRSLALQHLECMGIVLDEERNRSARGFEEVCRISTDDSKIAVLVVPTDEERMIARESIGALRRSYFAKILEAQKKEPVLIEVSAHHVHLTQAHVEALFGAGHKLTWESDLSQPGQFACVEKVNLVGPKGRVERVRVLGPVRKATQIEISMTEQFKLGIHPPIRESGDLENTPGITLEGPAGSVTVDKGVICALRHVHMSPEDAIRYGVRDKSTVRIRVAGDRELVFGDVRVRVDPNFRLAMHIDTDEGNAAHLETGATGYIDGIQST